MAIGDIKLLQEASGPSFTEIKLSDVYTASDVLAKLLTVDGSGTLLDADKLDGQEGSYYTDIVSRLGYTPYNNANPSGFITASSSITGSSSSVINTVAGTNSVELVRGNMADNDFFRILVGGTATNAGFAEIATADDATEPIYVRQYTGVFTSLVRTATLLDGSGNTSFPGTISGNGLYDNGNRVYSASSRPTTLSGYGITDGVITAGTLLSGCPSSGNANLSGVQGAGVYLKDEASGTIWHLHSHGDSIRSYNGTVEKILIDSTSIGSQSVNYATTAGSAPANGGNSDTVDGFDASQIKSSGANLMPNSGLFSNVSGWSTNGASFDIDSSITYAGQNTLKIYGNAYGITNNTVMRLKAYTIYTISALVKGSSALAGASDQHLHIQNWTDEDTGNVHQETSIKYDQDITTSWKVVYQTFRTPASAAAVYCRFYFYPLTTSYQLNVAYIKLEEGSNYSDWTIPISQQWYNGNLTNLNQLTNGPGYTTNTGTVTSIVAGTGLSGGTISTSGTISVNYGTTGTTACVGNDSRLSDARPASDVYSWAKASTKPTYTASEVGAVSPSLGANIVLNSYNLDYSATLGSNTTYSGTIETGTVGENVAFGDVLYLKFSDGKWWKAKADSYTTTPAARMALGTISANASGNLLIEGNVRYDSWSFAANKVYLSAATAGASTTTQPSTTGNQIQVLGIAKTSTKMYFRPSYDVGEK